MPAKIQNFDQQMPIQLRRMIFFLLAGIVLLLCLRGQSGSARAAITSARQRPLSARVYRILGIHEGSRPYLPSLARLVAALMPNMHKAPAVLRAEFDRHLVDARKLVGALNDGADPTALRNQILRYLEVDGRYESPNQRKWRYGSLYDRMQISALLEGRAMKLARARKMKRATLYLRAAMLLFCQDDIAMGWENPLLPWVRPRVVPHWGWGFSPRRRRAMAATNRSIRAMLVLPAHGQRKLDDLYRIARRWRSGRFGAAFDAFCNITAMEKANGPISAAAAGGVIGHLRTAIATAPTLHWRYKLLANAHWVRRELNLSGHRGLAKKIKQVLQQWAVIIRADRAKPKLERNAILRWIKGASI